MRGFFFTASSFAVAAIMMVSSAYLLGARENMEAGRSAALRIGLVFDAYNNFAGIAALYRENIFSDSILEAASKSKCSISTDVDNKVKARLSQAVSEFPAYSGIRASVSNVKTSVVTSSSGPTSCSVQLKLEFDLAADAGYAQKTGHVTSLKTASVTFDATGVKSVNVRDDHTGRTDYP
ncbi:hypothetical protein HYS54_05055 [Candidatus Micrarchaeota archaeon]|nr:hypothetical protein [Candidatus Micrarchaeota archaeon]